MTRAGNISQKLTAGTNHGHADVIIIQMRTTTGSFGRQFQVLFTTKKCTFLRYKMQESTKILFVIDCS